MDNNQVKKVLVVFKTHLDIGFTDFAQNVLNQYCQNFIPQAVDLAFHVNSPNKKQFVWTVGAYLIDLYLKTAPKTAKKKFEQAIDLGYIKWQAMAFTTHSELMDEALVNYSLHISKKLDKRYGMKTIAGKMTDVPGHTIGLVPLLCRQGIEYLHIGVNDASRVPKVPPMFRWKLGNDEVVVHYAQTYGESFILKNGVALEFAHSHDNMGPPSQKAIKDLYQSLHQKYPNAHISAGTLDDFAHSLREITHTLPLVTQEIGDTWIHGIGTDPLKVSQYKRLSLVLQQQQGLWNKNHRHYETVMENLLLIAEHTWGLDCKKHLLDFTNWSKKAFQQARKNNITHYSQMAAGTEEQEIYKAMEAELVAYRGEGNNTSSYNHFEKSHKEQREYVEKAFKHLPADLQLSAKQLFTWKYPVFQSKGESLQAGKAVTLGHWQVTFGNHGELTALKNKTLGINQKGSYGLFEYETFSGKTVNDCFFAYGRNLDVNRHWAEYDFGKPGLYRQKDITDGLYLFQIERAEKTEDTLTLWLVGNEKACKEYGCPKQGAIVHRFKEKSLHTTLYWKNKEAVRSPEALWFHMGLGKNAAQNLELKKCGTWISPFEVVMGGANKLHGVQGVKTPRFILNSVDAPLLSLGGRHIYHVDNMPPSAEKGLWWNLYNNRWGTNFKQWFEEDMRYDFDLTFI